MKIFLFFFLIYSSSTFSKDLLINGIAHSQSKLYSMATKTIKPNDPTFKGKVTFKVIPFEKVISLNLDMKSVKFEASDGFISHINGQAFKKGKAFLAIENPDDPWPLINEKLTAGPYYLIWTELKDKSIGQEQWPFQIASISLQQSVENLYPVLLPSFLTEQARSGFKVYMKNCLSCHRLSGYGEAVMGPDLNIPMNPTEYFKLYALKKYIRNPRSVRKWRGMKMPGFDEKAISEKDLTDLIQYLIEISKIK